MLLPIRRLGKRRGDGGGLFRCAIGARADHPIVLPRRPQFPQQWRAKSHHSDPDDYPESDQAASVAAASLRGVGWLSTQAAALRPVWTLFHVAAMVLGLALVWRARQPVWLEASARQVWGRVRAFNASWGRGAPLAIGALWAFLPCGLLYSALLVAALTSHALDGAAVMALFALGSSAPLMAGPRLLLRVGGDGSGQWGTRLAGAALATTSGWALWMGFAHNTAPWCLTS